MRLPTLTTDRLSIRPFTLDDLAPCHEVLGAVGDPISVEDRREWLGWTVSNYRQLEQLQQPPYGDRAIVLRSDGSLIGSCGLVPCLAPFGQLADDVSGPTRWRPEVGLYYELGPSHRGRGYATEMLRQALVVARSAGVDRVLVICDDNNMASSRVIEANGGKLEPGRPIDTDGHPIRRYWID